jgi:hypothetical protein
MEFNLFLEYKKPYFILIFLMGYGSIGAMDKPLFTEHEKPEEKATKELICHIAQLPEELKHEIFSYIEPNYCKIKNIFKEPSYDKRDSLEFYQGFDKWPEPDNWLFRYITQFKAEKDDGIFSANSVYEKTYECPYPRANSKIESNTFLI